MMRTIVSKFSALALLLLLSSCSGGGSSPTDASGTRDSGASDQPTADQSVPSDGQDDVSDGGPDNAITHGYALPEFPGGNAFYIHLPPTFSQFLPLYGEETTREPPGFYDPQSAYYFAYEYIWWLIDNPDLSTTALRSNLRDYYAGLCKTTVSVTLDDPASPTPMTSPDAGAAVLVARRQGTLEAGTCFGNPVPTATLDVSTYTCPDHAAVIVMVSPQSASDQVKADLQAVRDAFRCW